jgi:aerobic carbon-monoxide dehydrogenase medium subunit
VYAFSSDQSPRPGGRELFRLNNRRHQGFSAVEERGAPPVSSFRYYHPTTWKEAVQLVAEPRAVAKMGGCDVMTRQRRGKLDADSVVALHLLPEIGEITTSFDGVRIGAAVTLQQLAMDPGFRSRWPLIADVAGAIASPAIRAWATAVGNVAQGWSVSDLVPLFAVCHAELHLIGPSGERRLAVTEYANQPGTKALNRGEIIAALLLPSAPEGFVMSYERFAFREGFALPLVAVAIGASVRDGGYDDPRIAAVGATSMPARLPAVEAALAGAGEAGPLEAALPALAQASDPIGDFRASAAYRRQLLSVVLRRALKKLTMA